ncbi:MAG: PAS domain S-box protein, partial [Gemmatimonadaceae bacterium]
MNFSAPLVFVLAGCLVAILTLAARVSRARDRVRALSRTEARFRALIHHSSDVTLIVAPDGVIHYASPAAVHTFGRSASSLEGVQLLTLVHAEDAESAERFLDAAVQGRAVLQWRIRSAGGSWAWTENTASDLTHEPSVGGVVINVRDISERRSLETRLTYQAYHDSLTRLANRSLFLNRVGHAVARVPRARRPSAVLFLDLDDFKKVNDSLG